MIAPTIGKEVTFQGAHGEVMYFIASAEKSCVHHLQKDHMLAYVYSGELTVHDGTDERSFAAGSSVFIRKNHRVRFSIHEGKEQAVKIAFLVFKRNFLISFYRMAEARSYPCSQLPERFLEINAGPEVRSLFYSMIPFIDSAVPPPEKTMELKLREGIYTLLSSDDRTAVALFDFIAPWKIDLLEFLNENFMYELTLEEIAQYTGRSLAAFKRDFRKVSSLSPSKWITDKRLEVAHQQMKYESRTVSDI